jgi:protein O-mannosyl-transferase
MKPAPSKKKKISPPKKGYLHLNLLFIIIVTIAAFLPTLDNYFVNWDDIVYIMNNDMIKTFSLDKIYKMFSSFFMGNYHPLTILSFSFDYNLFELNAKAYHIHNLFLHVINTILVYIFCFKLFNRQYLVAFIVSFLFGIHPMHVESVAWVSERKDLLYTLYYLLAIVSYLFYIQMKDWRYFALTVFLFILSCLAKAQAVTLPMVLILIDYYLSRKPDRKTLLEKIPFFIIALVFGIVSIFAQKFDNAINQVGVKGFDSLFFGNYSIWVYFYKFFVPVNLNCLYQYPYTVTGNAPWYVYLSPVIILVLAAVIYKTWKHKSYITFGLLFFLVTILPVLQFLPVGDAIVAERYSYIPYIGLFMVAGIGFEELRQKISSNGMKKFVSYLWIVVFVIFFILTWNRTKVWAESISLWTDVMKKNPRSMSAYINRSFMYNQNKEYDKALQDCNDALKIDSNNYKVYINRAISYRMLGKYDLALRDLTITLKKNPESYGTYLDRGIIYIDNLDKYDLGIADVKEFLKYFPDHADGTYNLAVGFFKKAVFDSSWFYCQKAIVISPKSGAPHYLLAKLYELRSDFQNAYFEGSQAKSFGFPIDDNTMQFWQQKSNLNLPMAPR